MEPPPTSPRPAPEPASPRQRPQASQSSTRSIPAKRRHAGQAAAGAGVWSSDTPHRCRTLSCKRCRSRKVKCDDEFPKCSGCAKANVPCIVADFSAPRDYTRSEVHELEEKLHHLSSLAAGATTETAQDSGDDNRTRADAKDHQGTLPSRFVGPASGFNFIRPIMETMRNEPALSLLKQLSTSSGRSSTLVHHQPHSLPARPMIQQIMSSYFRDFHLGHPFLEKNRIFDAVDRVLDNDPDIDCPTASRKLDLFQVNLVMAIGSIRLFRDHEIDMHPFGFFTAALEASPPPEFGFNTLEDIENILLISHFGIFYNIGCSIWELGRLNLRICVELQLHRRSSVTMSCTEQNRRSRLFWESYLVDRLSSATLGRPFALNDADIDATLPAVHSAKCNRCLNSEASQPADPAIPIFHHLVCLGRITSEIQCVFHDLQHPSVSRLASRSSSSRRSSTTPGLGDSGDLFSHVHRFHERLRTWRQTVPSSSDGSCLYQNDDFFELSYQEARLWLLRAAIDQLAAGSCRPPDALLRPCLQAACGILVSFDSLRRKGLVTFTRAFTHLIFTTGLVFLFVLRALMHSTTQPHGNDSAVDISFWFEELDDGSTACAVGAYMDIIRIADDTLAWFATQMPDVTPYSQLFRILIQDFERFEGNIDLRSSGRPVNDVSFMGGSAPEETWLRTSAGGGDANMAGVLQNGMPDNLWEPGSIDDTSLVYFNNHSMPNELASESVATAQVPSGLGPEPSWPFSDLSWMEDIDFGMSVDIWDNMVPWQTSPSASSLGFI